MNDIPSFDMGGGAEPSRRRGSSAPASGGSFAPAPSYSPAPGAAAPRGSTYGSSYAASYGAPDPMAYDPYGDPFDPHDIRD